MDYETKQIIEAMAINEEKIMELYKIYASRFSGDAGLWNKLAEEEKMHAHMVRALGDLLKDNDVRFNKSGFSMNSLKNLRERLDEEIIKANDGGYNAELALEFAAKLEKTLLESKTFEAFESNIPDMKKLFNVIINETQKHAKILEEYRS